jgi:hypothetical protein
MKKTPHAPEAAKRDLAKSSAGKAKHIQRQFKEEAQKQAAKRGTLGALGVVFQILRSSIGNTSNDLQGNQTLGAFKALGAPCLSLYMVMGIDPMIWFGADE